uniref:NADH:ubiquinone reductase (H(+)-translocating) n=1 Tax=Cladonema pacificum TaxID=499903 RepID=A0A0S2IA62_9CNID|nr:NADH dehydrogenase subunit 2 [Cladonema pacificum]
MNFFIFSYIILLSLFFFRKQTIFYMLISILVVFFLYNGFIIKNINFNYQDYWFVFLLTWTYYFIIESNIDSRKDIYFLKFLVWLGSLFIILSSNLIIIYIGLELQTFSLFVLISKNRVLIKSSEAGLKYFILGALSSGFFLISSITIYSLFDSIDLIYLCNNYNQYFSFYCLISVLGLSLFFKLSLFPLHFWIPDIYEGSSSDVLSLIATLPKISVLSLLLKLQLPLNILMFVGLSSIIIGCLGGLNQTKIKRLLAYSSISHLGFTILGIGLFGKISLEISLVYFLIYIISSIGLLIFLVWFSDKDDFYIIELSGLQFSFVLWGLIWCVLFLSIAGLPPLSGFLGKWWIIVNLINANYVFFSLIIVIFSTISISFYLRISKLIYFQPKFSYITWYSVLKPKKSKELTFYIISFVLYFSIFGLINPNIWSSLVYFFWI